MPSHTPFHLRNFFKAFCAVLNFELCANVGYKCGLTKIIFGFLAEMKIILDKKRYNGIGGKIGGFG